MIPCSGVLDRIPGPIMRNQEETVLHQRCYKWFHNNYPDLRLVMWHTENEGKRNKRHQMIVKSLGLTSGVADMLFLYNGIFYAIEFKNGNKGRQSKSQKKWQTAIEAQNGKYYIIRTETEFKSLIHEILNP